MGYSRARNLPDLSQNILYKNTGCVLMSRFQFKYWQEENKKRSRQVRNVDVRVGLNMYIVGIIICFIGH